MGEDSGALGGILGTAIGESAAETKARVDEAKKTATDLTGLVRKKAKDAPAPAASTEATASMETNGKRKAEEPVEEDSAKKAKVDA